MSGRRAAGFGETDIFDVVTTPWMLRVQERLQKLFGFAMPLFHGRGVFNYRVGILPHRRPINVVVGQWRPARPALSLPFWYAKRCVLTHTPSAAPSAAL